MRIAAVVLVLCAACGGSESSADDAEEPIESGSGHPLTLAARPSGSGALRWYGGPVLERARVVAVMWGPAANPPVGDFYKTFVGSAPFKALAEYDTSKQKIGAGSFAGIARIEPRTKSKSLTDKQVERELAAQIRDGALPVPDANTVFMIHFPPGIRISLGSSHSCESGGFCGYHSAFKVRGKRIAYAVLPDMSNAGCVAGCGGGSALDRLTSVASHELCEAVTDPEVGLAKSLAPPLAWYDANGGEVGDLCVGQTKKLGGYVIQKEWSNAASGCR